ncbi:hypothetical protein RRG08_062986 [Elysia crispata]|uniref:Uncharacterized protein n=1 Tax=Elysia crispata TaxID=231223 RepID=A0AAE0YH94_9GAST|nr:hypothetical protein RRG08_062941 [Elysia crispata]KAK3745129.1 hypothetical protein RRG08_062956 [Elysia crispata]KAK3745144.1 hypothetical protein RRG08_062971 [Elysia crispata]KAK3745159.1 hypothetical protein RRG08_062986 [Elysia crispata]
MHRKLRPSGKSAFISSKPIVGRSRPASSLVTLDNFLLIAWPCAGDASFKCLPYQISMGSIPEREHEKRLPHPRKAAGAQLTHSRHGEVVTKNNNTGLFSRPRNWNEYTLNPLTRTHWRASLVPAAAVIPAPIAYIKVVAVKKLVVGSQAQAGGPARAGSLPVVSCPTRLPALSRAVLFAERPGWPARLL